MSWQNVTLILGLVAIIALWLIFTTMFETRKHYSDNEVKMMELEHEADELHSSSFTGGS